MLVLGVDPGLTRCGVGVVAGEPGRSLRMHHVEVIRTGPEQPLPERLLAISDRLDELVSALRPDVVAIERVFSQQNVQTVMGTAQAAAAAMLVAARQNVSVAWHTPTEVKAAVTGSGRAHKQQVAGMVVRLLALTSTPRPVDATDALALAICQIWRGPAERRLQQAMAGAAAPTIPRTSGRAGPR